MGPKMKCRRCFFGDHVFIVRFGQVRENLGKLGEIWAKMVLDL